MSTIHRIKIHWQNYYILWTENRINLNVHFLLNRSVHACVCVACHGILFIYQYTQDSRSVMFTGKILINPVPGIPMTDICP